MSVQDDLTAIQASLTTVTTDISTVQTAVEQAVTDVNNQPVSSDANDALVADIITAFTTAGYTVTPPAPAVTPIPVTDGSTPPADTPPTDTPAA